MLVSPQRATRPWQGQVEALVTTSLPAHDPDCYLCAGNTRANGEINPAYVGPYVFANDFPALLEGTVGAAPAELTGQEASDTNLETGLNGLFRNEAVSGVSQVICYSESHDLTLPEMTLPMIRKIVDTWTDLYLELGRKYQWVQIFENKGAINGCSNPHPHGQVWASDCVPTLVNQEQEKQKQYMEAHGHNLLVEYCQQELAIDKRIVCKNSHWVAMVPYWATWPFETLLLPARHLSKFTELSAEEKDSLAEILRILTIKYDNLFQTSFPYSMGWHCAPELAEGSDKHWQLHAHFYPPLLRSATVRKFMVGYEMLAESQRDMTPEQAAERLQQLPDVHYRAHR